MKILLVDDSAPARILVKRMLGSFGITDVTEAADGLEAILALGAGQYDVVLMDWEMPRLSGIEALRRIKANPGLKDTPVIMVTGATGRNQVLAAAREGVSNYLVKPFTVEALGAKLAAFQRKRPPG